MRVRLGRVLLRFRSSLQRRDIFYNNAARFLRLAASDGRVGPSPVCVGSIAPNADYLEG